MDGIKYKPTTTDLTKEITLSDTDFMFYTLLTELIYQLKRSNMKQWHSLG